MKRLFIYLLMLSSILCQDKLLMLNGQKYDGKYIKTDGTNLVFLLDGTSVAQNVPKETVESLILDGGEIVFSVDPVWFDRVQKNIKLEKVTNNKFIETEKVGLNNLSGYDPSSTINLEKVGSGLIALSGALLFATNRMELDDDATIDYYEDMVDKIKLRTDIAYLSLAIGGLLLAIGEPAN